MDPTRQQQLRRLPKVDEVLRGPLGLALLQEAPRWAVRAAVRAEIDRLRNALRSTSAPPGRSLPAAGELPPLLLNEAALRLEIRRHLEPPLVPVINATGVVLHTNLGRAPLAAAALAEVARAAGGYCNLELRLADGTRGSRHDHAAALLAGLSGAEAHLVVNNNAAAVVLALAGLCAGREVVLSRGELVEIGGSFRVPDVMRAAGARLVEVGTTNRTHRADYEAALGPETAALMKVHQSNFAQVGFTKEVPLRELCALGKARGVITICDLGSGMLIDLGRLNPALRPTLAGELSIAEAVACGCDLVLFSCDKLLGGPQAGVLAGRRAVIDALRRHPLLRALRPDKMTLAALCATLALYRDAGQEVPAVPALQMIAATPETLRPRAERLQALLLGDGPLAGLSVAMAETTAAVGGGSLPRAALPSLALALRSEGGGLPRLAALLRCGNPAVLGRLAGGRLLLDLRTVTEAEVVALAGALRRGAAAWQAGAGPADASEDEGAADLHQTRQEGGGDKQWME